MRRLSYFVGGNKNAYQNEENSLVVLGLYAERDIPRPSLDFRR